MWFYEKCGKNENACSFFLSCVYYVPSEWIVPQLHSIGNIVKKKVFLIAVVSLLFVPFPQGQFTSSLYFVLLISLQPLAHHSKIFMFFPSISSSENSLLTLFTKWTWIFPLCQTKRPHFYFYFMNVMSNLSNSDLVLSHGSALASFAECVILE